jgi:hypothetical protein
LEATARLSAVWWFNGYNSTVEPKQLADDYARNTQLLAALKETNRQKARFTGEAVEILASYRPDQTIGTP